MSPKNFSLRTKLLGGFLAISSLVLLISFFTLNATDRITELFEKLVHVDSPRLIALLEIRNTASEIESETLAIKFSSEGTVNVSSDDQKNQILANVEKMNNNIDLYNQLSSSDEAIHKKKLADVSKITDDVIDSAFQLLALKEQGASSAAVLPLEKKLLATEIQLRKTIDTVVQEELALLEAEDKIVEASVAQTNQNTLIVSIVAVLFAIGGGLLLSLPIIRNIRKLRNAAFDVAGGNLNTTVVLRTKDEIGQLAISFNEMTKKLREQYQQLTEEKAKDEIMLQSIGDGMIAIDGAAKIVKINTIAQQLVDTDGKPVIGKDVSEAFAVYGVDNSIVAKQMRAEILALQSAKSVTAVFLIKRRDGTTHTINIIANPVVENQVVIGAIMILRDVTKEREVDRMKTEFISLASHQLRTPLSAIKWFTEMLLGGDAGPLNPEQTEMTKNIGLSTVRMIDLVNSLLNISRIESGRIMISPTPTDLKALVESVVIDLQEKIQEKQQQLVISVHEGLPKISIDTRLISQVYMNLLTNAIKYTPKKGEISVFISRKGEDIISQITDNGYGIPKAQQDKVFQKFFRAANAVKIETDGTGLGLYLIKAIVESSKGKLWFSSEEGKGTTFWFSIPVSGTPAKKGEVTLD